MPHLGITCSYKGPEARFSKVPIIRRTRKAVVVYIQDRGFNSFADKHDKTISYQNNVDWFVC